MYPVIPHHLLKPPAEVTSSSVKALFNSSNKATKSSHIRNATSTLSTREAESTMSVTAVTDIPRGTCSEDINVADLIEEKTSLSQNIAVCVSEEGKLRTVGCDSRWLLEARLADDCHSYNVLLQKGGAGNTVVLYVVKSIRNGEELQLWFSEQMLVLLAVPFLTPLNIQGEKTYVCDRCGRHFEIPNPLKMHLALDCDCLNRSHLWKRLSRHLSSKRDGDGTTEQHRSCSVPLQSISSLSHTTTCTLPAFGFKFELVSRDDRNNYTILSSPQDLSAVSNTVHASNTETSSSLVKNADLQAVQSNDSHSVRQNIRPISEPLNVRSSAFKPYWRKRIGSSSADNIRANSHNERTMSMCTAPNSESQLISQPRILFHPPSYLSGTNLQMQKSSAIGLFSANSLLVPRLYHKQNVLPSTNFQQQPSEATTTEFRHAAEMETLVSSLGRSKQGHLCIYCGKIYSRKYGLKIHIRTHTGYKPLKCKYCLRPFGDPSNLNKHVRLHAEGETPYKCDLCGKILVRRRDLERHIKSRHSPHIDAEQDKETNKNQTS